MKQILLYFTFFLLISTCSLFSADQRELVPFNKTKEGPRIIINNRILAKINGKTISTYDVTRKMDMLFYSQFPQYLTVPEARFQFYQFNWKDILEELINKELILADAKERKVEVSSGDVRQEMETLFGPNIIENLDKAGMTFNEASKIVAGDLLIKRMLNYRVNGKAMRIVTPIKVKNAYELFIQDPKNGTLNRWNYRVVTVQERSLDKTQETADKVYTMLWNEKVPLDKLVDTVKERKILGRKGKVTVSELILNNEQELSDAYKKILSEMDEGEFSHPTPHKSRANKTNVYRIFYLHNKLSGGMPPFKEMEPKLKDKLLNEFADQETKVYLDKLRHHFHIRPKDLEAMIPPDYQPYVLK